MFSGLLRPYRWCSRPSGRLHRRFRQHLPVRLHGRQLPRGNEQGGMRRASQAVRHAGHQSRRKFGWLLPHRGRHTRRHREASLPQRQAALLWRAVQDAFSQSLIFFCPLEDNLIFFGFVFGNFLRDKSFYSFRIPFICLTNKKWPNLF